jgi:hypothetical protein
LGNITTLVISYMTHKFSPCGAIMKRRSSLSMFKLITPIIQKQENEMTLPWFIKSDKPEIMHLSLHQIEHTATDNEALTLFIRSMHTFHTTNTFRIHSTFYFFGISFSLKFEPLESPRSTIFSRRDLIAWPFVQTKILTPRAKSAPVQSQLKLKLLQLLRMIKKKSLHFLICSRRTVSGPYLVLSFI